MTRLIIGLLCIALTSTGCKILPERQPITTETFTLTPEIQVAGPSAAGNEPTTATLLVSTPRARPGYDSTAMIYIRRAHEIEYFSQNQWAETPARMLVPLFVKAIEKTGRWAAVAQLPSAIRADYRLDMEDLVLEHDFLVDPSRIHLAIRAQLVELKTQRIVGSQRFEVFQESAPNPYGGVMAANVAVTNLLQQIADWLDKIKPVERPNGR